jgi:GNAT superfamily N-acetyltransferase
VFMDENNSIATASLEAGREIFDVPARQQVPRLPTRPTPWVVPVRSLGPNHRDRIADHLKALDQHDRYLRFGYAATDEQINRYVTGLDFGRDEIFGIYNRNLKLLAMAHLAYAPDTKFASCVEFGVSVLKTARGRGFGALLFERAAKHAQNHGSSLMFIHALSENHTMLKIARNAGAIVQQDGSESEAYLRLPPATLDSRMTEILEEQLAQADYRLKAQAKHFWGFLADMQFVRRGVMSTQHHSDT